MGNYENIREYAEFSHEAAPHGGPRLYLEEYGNGRYECGREVGKEEQKEEDQFKIIFAVAGTAIACAFIGWEKQKFNEFKQKRLRKRAEQAKESYLKVISEEEAQGESDRENANKVES